MHTNFQPQLVRFLKEMFQYFWHSMTKHEGTVCLFKGVEKCHSFPCSHVSVCVLVTDVKLSALIAQQCCKEEGPSEP